MKKFLIGLLVALSLSLTTTTEAGVFDPHELTWVVQNDGTYWYLVGTAWFTPDTIDSFELNLPLNPYQIITNGTGDESRIEFYYDSTYSNSTLIFEDYFSDSKIERYYDIDLYSFDYEIGATYGNLWDSNKLEVYIQLTTDGTFTYTDMLAYYNSDATIEWHYDTPDYRDLYFYQSGTNLVETNITPVPCGLEGIVISYANNGTLLAQNNDGSRSRIRVYDSTGLTLYGTYYLDNYLIENSNSIIIPFNNDNTICNINLMLYRNTDDMTMFHFDYLNRNITWDYSGSIVLVEYYSLGSLIDSEYIVAGNIPDEPSDPTPPTGFEFHSWKTTDGDIYDYTESIPDSLIVNGTVRLTAQYKTIGSLDDPATTDPLPETDNPFYVLISGLGWATDAGFTMVYLASLVVVIVLGLLAKLPSFVILVVIALITAFFLYLGFLPLIVSTLAISGIVIGLLYTFKGEGGTVI